jgi:DNA-binding NarL/FixJ family response regulator
MRLFRPSMTHTRAGVRLALTGGGFTVCADVSDGPGAVAAALRERPDICLLDVHMPGGGGSRPRRRSRAASPAPRS